MALYLISYDIAEKDAFEYEKLWAKLKEVKAVRILYSEWMVTAGTDYATDLYSELAPLTQAKDRLLVQEVTKDAFFDKLLISDESFRKLLLSARY
jgi:CRISPR/Cas system-associated endoribonuclease Cas2